MRDYLFFIFCGGLLFLAGWRMRFWCAQLRRPLGRWSPWSRKLPMQVNCGWCGVVMTAGVQPVSHGICKPCEVRLWAEEEIAAAERLGWTEEDERDLTDTIAGCAPTPAELRVNDLGNRRRDV